LIEALHKNLVYIRGDKDITTPLDGVTTYLTQKQWRQYCVFQSEYKERLNVLRAEKREIPKESGADKNMPPILHTWEGKFSATQQLKNFKKNLSCAFNEERIRQYEELNKKFLDSTKLQGPAAAGKIIPLMIMDIAYIKSFDVDWDGPCPALETHASADDDDDEEIDTSAWDVTDPSTIPFNDLPIPKKGKLPTALLYAASLLAVAEPRPQNVGRWLDSFVERFNELKAQAPSNDLNDIIKRPMHEHEMEMYTQFMNKDTAAARSDAAAASVAAEAAEGGAAAAATPPRTTRSSAQAPATPPTPRGAAAAPPTSPPEAALRAAAAAGGAVAVAAAAVAGGASGGSGRGRSGGGGGAAAAPPPPAPARSRRAAAAPRDDAATEDDESLPSKTGGRTKQMATRKIVNKPQPADRQQPAVVPSNNKVIVKKRKSEGEGEEGRKRRLTTESPIGELSIPISDHSNRVMLGQLDINKRFPKNYMARHPIKKAPLKNMTISSLWHAVCTLSAPCCNNEFIFTHYV